MLVSEAVGRWPRDESIFFFGTPHLGRLNLDRAANRANTTANLFVRIGGLAWRPARLGMIALVCVNSKSGALDVLHRSSV
jgi:hypothetical protein